MREAEVVVRVRGVRLVLDDLDDDVGAGARWVALEGEGMRKEGGVGGEGGEGAEFLPLGGAAGFGGLPGFFELGDVGELGGCFSGTGKWREREPI